MPVKSAVSMNPGLDESIQAFIKLKELQPQQQALQQKLDTKGSLDEDDHECFDFINDEIHRLLEVLHEHGFNFPECVEIFLPVQ
jgi:hypothetical protein